LLSSEAGQGETAKMKVSRNSVGRFLADAVQSPAFVGKVVALSGALAPTAAPAIGVRAQAPEARY
jgi:hypothetical protein